MGPCLRAREGRRRAENRRPNTLFFASPRFNGATGTADRIWNRSGAMDAERRAAAFGFPGALDLVPEIADDTSAD